jgi:hypothetical protein
MKAKEDESKKVEQPIVKIPKWIYVQWAMKAFTNLSIWCIYAFTTL